MSPETAADYTVRWYDPADREAFVSLYNDTFGGGSDEWFQWKYVDNPRTAHVPILVATADGELAGARAQTPFLMRAGDETALAMRFGDTMVHPDHRRKGVFSRLVERALNHYREMPVRFCYNVPNDLSRPGFLKAGGEIVSRLPSFYRVQNPQAFGSNREGPLATAARAVSPAAQAYLDVRDALADRPTNATVVRHTEIPVSLLRRLYERARPPTVHAVRDDAMLEWRYENPRWRYHAYAADVDGRPAAAVVTGTQTDDGVTTTTLVDVLPLADAPGRETGLRALLSAVVADNADADLLAYCGRSIPDSLLRAHGFHRADGFLLDRATEPTRLVAYDLGDEPWTLGDVDLSRDENWGLSYVELDAR